MLEEFQIPTTMIFESNVQIQEYIPDPHSSTMSLFIYYGQQDLELVPKHC